jgi:hypothetical protein
MAYVSFGDIFGPGAGILRRSRFSEDPRATADPFGSQLSAAREEFGWAKRPFKSKSKMGSSRHVSALEENWTWILKNSIDQ